MAESALRQGMSACLPVEDCSRIIAMESLRNLSLFTGIGGIELGLVRAGLTSTSVMCEWWDSARLVLDKRFPSVQKLSDVRDVQDMAGFDIVSGGFPCTDLSQAGRTVGLDGAQSGLIRHVLEVFTADKPEWLLLENVPNMLRLSGGRAIAEIVTALETAGYRWAYRTIDSRAFGLPHRRRRVYLLASRNHDPAVTLFRSAAGNQRVITHAAATGFYWTEGNRGLGWAPGAVPTLKGSTTVSVPRPPAVWRQSASLGAKIVTPSIEAAEILQGFKSGWTQAAPSRDRWKLVGNAVTVDVSAWIGRGLRQRLSGKHREPKFEDKPFTSPRWPSAAMGSSAGRYEVDASEWPQSRTSPKLLTDILDRSGWAPLSERATKGFAGRLAASRLRHPAAFMADLEEHVEVMAAS